MKHSIYLLFFGISLLPFCAFGQTKNAKLRISSKAKANINNLDSLFAYYNFDSYLKTAERLKDESALIQLQYEKAQLGQRMLAAVERVIFIDSIVLSRGGIIEYLNEYTPFKSIHQLSVIGKELFAQTNQFLNQSIQSKLDSTGIAKLHKLYRVYNQWVDTGEIPLFSEENESLNFPFLQQDGITLYYAAKGGDKSLGGYDIFITRYDAEHKKYLSPENIGMPFNSPANDYLLLIDELNNLGCFVSDRYQHKDSVCIYFFIPSKGRDIYKSEDYTKEEIKNFAKLSSIFQTQTDSVLVNKARKLLTQNTRLNKPKQISFNVSPTLQYSSLQQFRNPASRANMESLLEKEETEVSYETKLHNARYRYSLLPESQEKDALKEEIQSLERQTNLLKKEIRALKHIIRSQEISTF